MKITVTDLRALDGDSLVAVRLLIQSEEGERDVRTYHILPEQYAALRLRCGEEVEPDTVDSLEEAARLSEAIRKGISLLSYGMQSERALKRKLTVRGFSEELAAAAVAYLRKNGCFHEAEDAMRVVQGCRRKHWGMRRILSHLYEKGYPERVLREVQAELEGEDFVPDCVALIRARYRTAPESREEKQKMTAALMRYGYSLGEIRRAIEQVMEEDEEE